MDFWLIRNNPTKVGIDPCEAQHGTSYVRVSGTVQEYFPSVTRNIELVQLAQAQNPFPNLTQRIVDNFSHLQVSLFGGAYDGGGKYFYGAENTFQLRPGERNAFKNFHFGENAWNSWGQPEEVVFQNCVFDKNFTTHPTPPKKIIFEDCIFKNGFHNPNNALFNKCLFENGRAEAFAMWNSSNVIVMNSRFDNTNRGLNFQPHWGDIHNNAFLWNLFVNIGNENNGGEVWNFEVNNGYRIRNNIFAYNRILNCIGSVTFWHTKIKDNLFDGNKFLGNTGIYCAGTSNEGPTSQGGNIWQNNEIQGLVRWEAGHRTDKFQNNLINPNPQPTWGHQFGYPRALTKHIIKFDDQYVLGSELDSTRMLVTEDNLIYVKSNSEPR